MSEKLKVVHYINQFFAQLGGEDNASIGIQVKEEPIGPGLSLQNALGERAEIVATVICGDNHIAENLDKVTGEVLNIIESYNPDIFFAGPAFNAGRYGVACGSICTAVKNKLHIPAVTSLFIENPGVDIYSKDIFILKSENNARKMVEETKKMVDFAFKLYENKLELLPDKAGFFERGWMVPLKMDKMASTRAIDMLLDKYHNRPFATEIFLPQKDEVSPPPPIKNLSQATVVFATDGGLYPIDNPDNMKPANSTTFHAYSVEGQNSLNKEDYTIIHNGFDKSFLLDDPNRIVPLDAMRELENEGVVKMHNAFLSTTGLTTNVVNSKEIGKKMVEYVKNNNIDAVILTST